MVCNEEPSEKTAGFPAEGWLSSKELKRSITIGVAHARRCINRLVRTRPVGGGNARGPRKLPRDVPPTRTIYAFSGRSGHSKSQLEPENRCIRAAGATVPGVVTDESENSGLRRVTRQGEEAIGKIAQELLENPVVSGALSAAFETRERAMHAQEVHGRAEPAFGERPRAAHAAGAERLAAARGHRGRPRPRRARSNGWSSSSTSEAALERLEQALSRRAAPASAGRVSRLARRAPLPERGARRRAARRRRSASAAREQVGDEQQRTPPPARGSRASANSVAVSISTATAPAAVQRSLLGRPRRRRTGRSRRPSRCGTGAGGARAALEQLGRGRQRVSPAPSARLVPSAAIASPATSRSPSSSRGRARRRSRPAAAGGRRVGELGDHDRGARTAHPGALDRQRLPSAPRPCSPTAPGCG